MNSFQSRLLRSVRRFSRAGVGVLLSAVVLSVAYAQPRTNVHLPAPARGAAAISALGAHLPDVANAYGLQAQGLIDLLQTQASLEVDQTGTLLFACDGLAVNPRLVQQTTGSGATVSNALTPTSSITILANGGSVDAFQLHSLPGATRVIYLDFDGHTTSGTQWNSSYSGGAPIVSAPFDLDGDPTTFNDTERAVIVSIWKRVAEDYAPFAIDVTTQDPGIESLRKTSSTDTAYGKRVVVSPTNWYNSGAGGVSYVGSFNWDSDTPCYIFSQQLLNTDKYMAEAASHELGHTLGLYHDGVGGSSPSEYYTGQGNWAPIMGVGYYKPITQFSKGEYAYANNTQDDLAVIATYAPLTGDDHGNTLATATVLSGPTVANGGTIETRSDVDVFRFDTGAGTIVLNVTSPAPEANLHVKAEVLNSSGQAIATNDPTSMGAAFNLTLASGTYYLRISSVGEGDPATTGYSNYDSLGNYLITGTIVATATKQAPVAAATATPTSGTVPLTVAFSGQGSTDADGSIVSYAWDFGDGSSATSMNPSHTYTSAGTFNATLTVTDNDGLMGSATVTINVAAAANQSPVAVASANVTLGLAPLAITFSSSGSYDPDGSIASYAWNFGDGTTSTSASPTKTYTTAGTYTATLTVTDNGGAKASSSITISVQRDTSLDVDVQQFTLTSFTGSNGFGGGAATIVIRDRLSRPVSGVSVTIQWSGLVSGNSTGTTDANGQVLLNSRTTKKSGTLTASITTVTPPAGRTYDASIFSEPTVRSITR